MRKPNNKLVCLAAFGAALGVSAHAGVTYAFPQHKLLIAKAAGPSGVASAGGLRPGADGIFYTGGAQDFGMKCSHCHIDDQHQQGSIGVQVVPSPAWEDVSGSEGYAPGTTYTITVNLTGAHLGNISNNDGDENAFALTIEDGNGKLAGVLEANVGGKSDATACKNGTAADPLVVPPKPTAGQTTVILGDCHAVVSTEHPASAAARTSWNFKWTAPAAGTGDVTIFVGAVDGDHEGKSSLGDDVVEASIVLKEK
jgi:hypothetical protein